MKTLVLKSNHGNHSDFSRKWTVLAEFESEVDGNNFLYDYLIKRDMVDEDGNPDTSYGGYSFRVVTEEDYETSKEIIEYFEN